MFAIEQKELEVLFTETEDVLTIVEDSMPECPGGSCGNNCAGTCAWSPCTNLCAATSH